MIQDKIDKLVSIVKSLKSDAQKNLALSLIIDIVNIINTQEREIKGLSAWKTNNKVTSIDCELEKYILLLITFGFSQKYINSIRTETLIFIAKNRHKFSKLDSETIKLIDVCIMDYEFEKGKLPTTYEEFKKYYNA